MFNSFSWRSWLFAGLASVTPLEALRAQIITDGSVGPQATLSGPDMTIGADLGSQRGNNLFHSFQQFDIPAQHTATFTGPDTVQNVIGRVTGGNSSRIDGTLRSQVGRADVYLINPAGVVMDPNAQVDVPAALHVSTADELRFPDGAVYSARDPSGSTLTMAAPEAFGFLNPQPAAIQLNGTQLEIKPEQKVSLTAGDIAIRGSEERTAAIRAPGGEIQLQAKGDLQLDNARIDTSGDGGGQIAIQARYAHLTQSTVATDNTGARHAEGGIDIQIDQSLELTAGSRIQSNTFSSGDSGKIQIQAHEMRMHQQESEGITGVFSEVAEGVSGNTQGIEIAVTDSLFLQGLSVIHSGTDGEGNSGNITISAGDLRADGGTRKEPYHDGRWFQEGISIATGKGSSGDAGSILVEVANQLDLNYSSISSYSRGIGKTGDITASAKKMTILDLLKRAAFLVLPILQAMLLPSL